MEELLRLGVLGDEDFARLLKCIVDTKTPTCDVCEVVRSAVQAREGTSSPAANNPLLTRLYWDILSQWLVPPLLEIILRYSTELSRVSSSSADIDITQRTNGAGSEHFPLDCSVSKDDGKTQQCCSELPQESASHIKYEEANLITKCDLVAVISKVVCGVPAAPCHVSEFGDSLRQGNSEVQETFKLLRRIYEAIATAFRMELQDVLCEEKRHRVKLLSLAFSSLLWDGCFVEVNGFQCAARQVVKAVLSTVEVWHDPDITASLFTLVIMPFVEANTDDRSEVIQKVWGLLNSLYSVGEDGAVLERSSVGLVVLCFLSDLMSDGEIFKWINMDEKFWVIVQYSLAHSDPFSRKRGRHVLRKCVDQYSSWKCSSQYLPQLEGQEELVMQLWNDFFLLLETLEEKQIHVVKPVLEKLDALISSCKKEVMHPSWAVVVLRRLLGQEGRTIRVWGAGKVLGLRLSQQVLEQGVLSFITHHLLPALADYSLYSREPDQQRGEPSRIGSQIPPFLSSVVGALDDVYRHRFMVVLFEKLFDGQPWGGIPLFYIVRSLALLPPVPAWKFLQSKKAAINLEACLSTQEIGLRSASQCDFLRALLKHSCPSTTFLEMCHLIGQLRRQESWQRGTTTWQAILESVKDCPESRQDRLRALQQAIAGQLTPDSCCDVPPHDVALGLCLAVEEEGGDSIGEALVPLILFLEDCHLRPYQDPHSRVWVVQLLTHMLQILCDSVPGTPACRELLLSGLSDGLDCLLQLFVSRLSSYSQPDHLEDLQLYLELLRHCNGLRWSQTVAWRHYPEVMEGCRSLLEQQQSVPASLGVVVLEHLLEYYFPAAPPHHQDEAALLLTLHPKALTQTRLLPGHELSTTTSRLLQVTPCSSWHCVELLLMAKEKWWLGKDGERMEAAVLEVLPECVASAGRPTIAHIFQVAAALAPTLVRTVMWVEVLEAMWAATFEFRKGCDLYRGLIGCLTDLLFHRDALACPDCHASIIKVSQELLKAGEGVQGIASHMALSLSSSLVKAGIGEPGWFKLLAKEVLVPLVMFGAVFRKQQRVVRDTLLFVGSYCWARAIVLRFLLTLRLERAEDKVAAAAVVEGIKYQYARASGHQRDFPNSQNHRYKTRLLQAFLLLVPLLNQNECDACLAWVCEGLTCDHQQPSIRYLQEWGAALLPILHPTLYPVLLHHHFKGVEVRAGCVGSFLAALTHVACTSSDPGVMSTALTHTLAWCTAQHFNTRLYAQVSLRKIWQHCKELQMEGVLQEFRAVPLCLVERGNAGRNTINMLNDFYFKVFHPVQHYTLQTIFHTLPQLSLLADDEWMSVEFLMGVAGEEQLPLHTSLPLHNTDLALTCATPAPWVVKAAGEEQMAEEEVTCQVRDVQKKIVPQKTLVPEMMPHPHQTGWEGRRGGLIVVASLVDKAANLGGLCRTCEAFGVRELVVASRAILQDHTFTSLSLTAHRWLPITEVRREDLLPYLKTKQGEGYTLVGAEQTAQSVSLEDFKFPELTVVVLGNERAGVPCEVLQVLQTSVQIPQNGIVRSLNVHVSGALFVWEYTRQLLTCPPGGGGGGGGGARRK
ncbi:putative methyltransferase TARBP1 [Portunus trituberculatus]|uniref:Putative methyltransferase TARBP1 n=1 Tax=Portunus trituberculatus TaxID=210409 RepID=A0A5B7CNI1_PORTR|nr:putative methyltransferase TARBP1 [Portunus trituberculatus]